MTISVKYFASLRERMGRSEDAVEAEAVRTVEDVWQRVSNGEPLPENVLAAVNMEYSETSRAVEDGDEVAFFPPVTGG
ncbi:MAG: molybdopterin converting factor subunit 1 [Gammaproteobacteria bacterium]|nr:molybdopterin converting factor subunit 1 [Gammaproteobacteria bacterium]